MGGRTDRQVLCEPWARSGVQVPSQPTVRRFPTYPLIF
jgi:hypothetical protein